MTAQFVLFVPRLEAWALLPLLFIPFLAPLARRLATGSSLVSDGLRPVLLGLAAAVPAAIAALPVYLNLPTTEGYAF
ncbi:MAG: hypothetical protein P8Q36_19255 [Alphaproteobacteria bacterium]|jgi:hypothetical protein|nr:hypothetical protein [Rhodospirillaceae bacterium]MDG2482979.1 hypothetical protein [Alphaproteobacteria bacterium]MBT6204132.1 hypothetical protein [Rhodospirillaceae bacterium]MBT6509319.1 hypothetical protein [Rhodospirillaceae bacterium]MBT7612323.1 hypothetical protein [Rhodospirillaceae bacterium]